jgi:dTDP-4-dehydrorhamnose 3,5-epimerase
MLATSLKDVSVVEMPRHLDDRGFFQEVYSHRWAFSMPMYTIGYGYLDWKQVNWSFSAPGVIRGIHVAPYAKFVTCVGGHVFDVVVDLRPESPTYLKWEGFNLIFTEPRSIVVPPGCGHGFAVIEPASVMYLQSDVFGPDKEWTVRWDDPEIAVQWPLPGAPVLSERDALAKTLAEIKQARSQQTVSASPHGGTSSRKRDQGPLTPTSSP